MTAGGGGGGEQNSPLKFSKYKGLADVAVTAEINILGQIIFENIQNIRNKLSNLRGGGAKIIT